MKTQIRGVLIVILLITTAIACNQNTSKKEVSVENDLIGDYWVGVHKDTLIRRGDYSGKLNFDGEFFLIQSENKIESGFVSWYEGENLDFTYDKDSDDIIDKIITSLDLKNKTISLYGELRNMELLDFNTIILVRQKKLNDEYDKVKFVRVPKFFPKKPIEYLKEKKEELDLGLITKAEYESLLQKTKKYIEY